MELNKYEINCSEVSTGCVIIEASSEDNAIARYNELNENGELSFNSVRRIDSIRNLDSMEIHVFDEIRVRNTSADICTLFEDILDAFGVTIPDPDRTGDECEARIFGGTYTSLEDAVTEILSELCNKVKHTPNANINTEEY